MHVEDSTLQNFYLLHFNHVLRNGMKVQIFLFEPCQCCRFPKRSLVCLLLTLSALPLRISYSIHSAHIPFWFNVVDFLRGREVLFLRRGLYPTEFQLNNFYHVLHAGMKVHIFLFEPCSSTATASTEYQSHLQMKISIHVTWSRNCLSIVEIFHFFSSSDRPHPIKVKSRA